MNLNIPTMKTAINVLLSLLLLPLIWTIAEQTNDRWAYVSFGVCLMLWPCQWAFRFGQKARAPRMLNIAGVECSEADLWVSLLGHPPGGSGADAARAVEDLTQHYGKNAD